MKNFLIPIFLCTALYASFVDLGQHAPMLDIDEINLKSLIELKYQQLDKKKLTDELIDSFESSLAVSNNINTCSKNKKRAFYPVFVADEDIYEPATQRLLFKKGTRLNALTDFNQIVDRYILFINMEDDIQKRLAYKYQSQAHIYVVNGNPNELIQNGIDAKVIPDQQMIDSLKLECVPSFYAANNDKFIIQEINPNSLVGEK
ncbi:MAG: hypothetical protein ACPGUI_00415 [Halarcobacter sp.]